MSPLFARIKKRIDLANEELSRVKLALDWCRAHPDSDKEPGVYARVQVCAGGVESVYTGIESIFELLAQEIDGESPRGADSHAELLKQMAVELPGVRPAVLSAKSFKVMDELRRFRDVVRKQYGSRLDEPRALDNLKLLAAAMLILREDIERLRAVLAPSEAPASTPDSPPVPGRGGCN